MSANGLKVPRKTLINDLVAGLIMAIVTPSSMAHECRPGFNRPAARVVWGVPTPPESGFLQSG
jgi:hypothetical protein